MRWSSGECGAESVADVVDVVDRSSTNRLGPLDVDRAEPEQFSGRAGVAGSEMNVKVRHSVAEHEAVDVLGARGLAESSAEPVHNDANASSLFVGQVTEAGNVAARLNHEVPEGRILGVDGMSVPGVDESVVVKDATWHVRTTGVLHTDKALSAGRLLGPHDSTVGPRGPEPMCRRIGYRDGRCPSDASAPSRPHSLRPSG